MVDKKLNAEDFLKQITPTKKGSKLVPFWSDIDMLRDKGCTLEQVKEFLEKNQIEITIAGLSKAIKKRYEKNEGFSKQTTTTNPTPKTADKFGQAETKVTNAEMEERLKLNPLFGLEAAPKEGEYNPRPKHKFERDDS